MKDNPFGASQTLERRQTKRYSLALKMEIWPEAHSRGAHLMSVCTRDVSNRGIYFYSQTERSVDSKFNFVLIFPRGISREDGELMEGLARTVRCERLQSKPEIKFGIAAAIEKTTYLVGE